MSRRLKVPPARKELTYSFKKSCVDKAHLKCLISEIETLTIHMSIPYLGLYFMVCKSLHISVVSLGLKNGKVCIYIYILVSNLKLHSL